MAQKISSLVSKKLDFYRKECNFTNEELDFFNLRAQDKKIIAICIEMPVSKSKADSLSKKIREKMAEADKCFS